MTKLKKEQFLPSITTTKGSDWRAKIKEIDRLGLKKIALFPTCLSARKQRKEMFGLLEQTELQSIPFVHLRGDVPPEELDYLVKRFNTQVFNLHPSRKNPILYDYARHKDKIYLETHRSLDEKELKEFAGICLDFSHLEDLKRSQNRAFEETIKLLEKYPIGCNHISASLDKAEIDTEGSPSFHAHYLKDFSQLDYLKNYPPRYFSQFCAVELENPLKEQLKAIDYIIRNS